MSEKLRPNFTPVPNVILDEIMRGLGDPELKVLLAICRYTYGWQKTRDRVSLSQLAGITGIKDRSNVHRAVKRLGDLLIVTPGDPRKNLAAEYKINIEISDDLLSGIQQELSRQQAVVRPVVTDTTIQRNSKERRNSAFQFCANTPPDSVTSEESGGTIGALAKISPVDTDFERAWGLYPKRGGSNPKKAARVAWMARIREGISRQQLVDGVERYAAFCRATGKEGTELVMQAKRFFGPEENWRESWELPRSTTHDLRAVGGFVG